MKSIWELAYAGSMLIAAQSKPTVVLVSRFGKVLIATGASVDRLPAPGANLAGVHYLRTAGHVAVSASSGEMARQFLHDLREAFAAGPAHRFLPEYSPDFLT